ncbi:unnamed protein product [Peronospora belbahrii]|uniref:Secreted protein n=1 Tax=Peronospora belbahrii TaxID=622444 RepID=A0AAU9KTZ0_9STRA|nr:unnamed protein product [Peronospora belbahrii]
MRHQSPLPLQAAFLLMRWVYQNQLECRTLLLRSVVGCFCRKPLTDDETAGLPQQRTRLQTSLSRRCVGQLLVSTELCCMSYII